MRILALVPGGISEQLLFFPALEDIKKAYPAAEIGVVVEPRAATAYRVSKIVDTVIPFTFAGPNSPSDWANLLGIIRDREYEVALSASTTGGIGFLLWLSGVPTRVTYDSTGVPWFYTRTVPDSDQSNPYKAERYRQLLSAIEVPAATAEATINLPEGDLAKANALRDRLKLNDGYVLIYPGPEGHRRKDYSYPTKGWQALIEDFRTKQPNTPVVLLETDYSIEQVNDLKTEDTTLIIATAENIGQTAALLAGANLVLTADNYIMQLAVALKVFTLALFGKYTPKEMLPPATGDETRFLGIASDSGNLADIPPETVLKKVWGG